MTYNLNLYAYRVRINVNIFGYFTASSQKEPTFSTNFKPMKICQKIEYRKCLFFSRSLVSWAEQHRFVFFLNT